MYHFDTISMPSGLACTAEDDDVAQDPRRLLVGAADQLVDRLDQLVRADHFGRVQAAVDPDDRLAFLRQRARLLLGHAARAVQLLRDLLVAIELGEVLRRGDDRRRAAAGPPRSCRSR